MLHMMFLHFHTHGNGILCFLALTKLAALDDRVKQTTKKGYQEGTTKNLRTYINRYLDYCLEFKVPPIPAKGQQLRRFAQYLSEQPTITAIETINNYLWGVKTFHKLLDLPPPDTREFLTTLALRGLKLTLARPIRQAKPIDPATLEKMFTQVDLNSEEQLVAWVALIFAFHLLLLKSNLVPNTQREFDPEKQLSRRNLCLAQNAILVEIEWSKTLQYKEKVLSLPLLALKNKILCPVYWTWRLIRTVPASKLDPVFCYHRNDRYMVLTYPRLTFWFKRWLTMAGIPPQGYTMHSFRRGGISFLHDCNISSQLLKTLGNWASEAYLRYIDITLGKRVEAAKKIHPVTGKIIKMGKLRF